LSAPIQSSRHSGQQRRLPAIRSLNGPPSWGRAIMEGCNGALCRLQGVRNLIAYCLNDACRHEALIDVSGYPDAIKVQSWRAKCGKCVDVRPNWKEAHGMPDNWEARWQK
jgi:hypothetical protein